MFSQNKKIFLNNRMSIIKRKDLLIFHFKKLRLKLNLKKMANETESEQFDLFISYENEMKNEAESLKEKLESTLETLKIATNTEKRSSIIQLSHQIGKSHLFIVLLTSAYTKSAACKRELIYAAKIGKQIFCFILEKIKNTQIDNEIEFIIENCICKKYYQESMPKGNLNWVNAYFEDAKILIMSNLNVSFIFFHLKCDEKVFIFSVVKMLVKRIFLVL